MFLHLTKEKLYALDRLTAEHWGDVSIMWLVYDLKQCDAKLFNEQWHDGPFALKRHRAISFKGSKGLTLPDVVNIVMIFYPFTMGKVGERQLEWQCELSPFWLVGSNGEAWLANQDHEHGTIYVYKQGEI